MRICLLNDSFPPNIDGVSNTIFNYATILNERYGDVIVATPRYPGAKDHYPFDVVRLPSIDTSKLIGYRAGNPFSRRALEKLVSFQPDIIHSHCPFISTVLARELRELTGAPIILTYHTKFDQDIGRAVRIKPVQDAVISGMLINIAACDEVWACNRGAGENLKELGYGGEYFVMPNGVDIDRTPVPPEELAALDAQYGLSPDVPLFLFIGRIMWYKGIRIILDSLRTLKNEGRAFRMVFVGDGLCYDEVVAYARTCGLEEECIFTGAILDRKILKLWYSRADLFLLPSVYDNNPLVVKEAAACATASVLLRGSSSAEGVIDGVNGLLTENGAGAYADGIRAVIDDRSRMRKLGENAARDLYVSWDDSVANAFARYCEFLAKRAPVKPLSRMEPIRVVSNLYRVSETGKNLGQKLIAPLKK